jgi:hypothetical protein
VTAPTTPFTQADYRRLPEGFPAQLIEGQLVKEPSPTEFHQGLTFKLGSAFAGVVGVHRILLSPIDVWIDEFNVLQPDLLQTVFDIPMLVIPHPQLSHPLVVAEPHHESPPSAP